ncbi:hypothetical protein DMI62_03970 [Escherichia coli]|nr:hypothetical protein [Escherichia coli]
MDVIVISAADAATIKDSLHYGVVDFDQTSSKLPALKRRSPAGGKRKWRWKTSGYDSCRA